MTNWAYHLSRRAITLLLALGFILASASATLAAEEAAETAGPQGVGMLVLLLGLGGVLAVGFILSSREGTNGSE